MIRAVLVALLGLLLVGCSGSPSATPSPSPRSSSPTVQTSPSSTLPPVPAPSASPTPTGPQPSDGRPRDALLSIPALGITRQRVVSYRGWTDDAPGTDIQNRGLLASPHGPRGGTGPGGIGNYQVTGHRLSSTQVFLQLPSLREGARVVVDVPGHRYVYRVTGTRETSFRSAASLRAQRAAVPGRLGVEPTLAMITLSTCATPEDRAAGNNWSDRFGNPEHRIDKVGVLVRSSPR